jgi:hypothetical protein
VLLQLLLEIFQLIHHLLSCRPAAAAAATDEVCKQRLVLVEGLPVTVMTL